MVYGSHNSWSYAKPYHWWLRPFHFMAKCQGVDIESQWNAGSRLFDIRIVIKNCKAWVAHGVIRFDVDVDDELAKLNELAANETVWVRVLMERNGYDEEFINWCKEAVEKYPNLHFFEGRKKSDWKVVFDFGQELPKQMVDKYSSCNHDRRNNSSGTWLDDLTPWIYAKNFNYSSIQAYKNQDVYLLLDFVGVYE